MGHDELVIIVRVAGAHVIGAMIGFERTFHGRPAGFRTGVGFLGAGVFFKEGLTVRGLTTAASISVTAAIGILVGIGFWFAAVVGALATLMVLALFRIEARLPSEFYAHHMLRFARDKVMGESEVHKMIGDHGFTIANLSSRLSEGGQQFEYRMTIKSRDRVNAEKLANHLRRLPEVVEFRITPTGDWDPLGNSLSRI